MGKKAARRDRLDEVNFYCLRCRHKWQATPDEVQDAPERDWHPWRYWANECPRCGAENVEQAGWERSLLKAYTQSTGPKTAEGRARVTANLAGHPTPEEAQRTRFNAVQNGLYSRVATYFPAKPGKYPQCEGCEYLNNGCEVQIACLKRTELFMKHQIAFETKDPALLTLMAADMQAGIRGLIDDMILTVIGDGVRLRAPKGSLDKDGNFRLHQFMDDDGQFRPIEEYSAHPLLKVLGDFLQKNAMSLSDYAMTPKAQDDKDVIEGYLDGASQDRESLLEYQGKTADALQHLRELVARGQQRAARDPVLIEYQQGDAADGGDDG